MQYKATQSFHFGALRVQVSEGDVLRVKGGLVHPPKGMPRQVSPTELENLVKVGYLEPMDTAMVLHATADTQRDAPLEAWREADKKHIWEEDLFGNGEKTCKVCGVSVANPLSINLSQQSMTYLYTDAYGVRIHSLKELPCPLFVGDLGGGVANNTYRTRKLKGAVVGLDDRVGRLEQALASEQESSRRRQELALSLLERLAAATERLVELGDSQAANLLPDQGAVLDILDVEEVTQEKVLVPVRDPLDEI